METLDLMQEWMVRFSKSPFAAKYLLRGSYLLHQWYPEYREPEDLDFVATFAFDPVQAFEDIQRISTDNSLGPPLFRVGKENVIPLYDYEEFPGIRVYVGTRDGVSYGVQVDIAFENTGVNTDVLEVKGRDETAGRWIATYSRSASLAAKLIWISRDSMDGTPDSVDMDDATFLIQNSSITLDDLRQNLKNMLAAIQFDKRHMGFLKKYLETRLDQKEFQRLWRNQMGQFSTNPKEVAQRLRVLNQYWHLIKLVHETYGPELLDF